MREDCTIFLSHIHFTLLTHHQFEFCKTIFGVFGTICRFYGMEKRLNDPSHREECLGSIVVNLDLYHPLPF